MKICKLEDETEVKVKIKVESPVRRVRENKLLLAKETASILRVSEEYLRSLIRSKKINAYKEGRRGGYRIPQEAINEYIVKNIKFQNKF